MNDIRLETVSYHDCTIGRISCDDFECFTLELPWKKNKRNVSCYPSGVYKYKKRLSPSKGCEVIELIGVPDRTFIQIHSGNFTHQILGCTLVGDSIRYLDSDLIPDVTNSERQMKKLLNKVPLTGTIEVIRHGT
jgi:hypothetical protein